MEIPMRFAALLLLPLFSPRQSTTITITTADDLRSAKSVAIKEVAGKLVVDYEPLTGHRDSIPCADVVEIAMGVPAQAPAAKPESIELVTTAGDTYVGTLGAAEEGAIHIATEGLGPLSFEFKVIDQIRFTANRATWPRSVTTYTKRICDSVFTTSADERKGSLVSAGAKEGIVLFNTRQGKNVTIGLGSTSTILFFRENKQIALPEPPKDLYAMVLLTDGGVVHGKIAALADGSLALTDLLNLKRTIKAASVAGIYFKNGRVVYLSDVKPSQVDENANCIRWRDPLPGDLAFPWQADRSAKGTPLKIRNQSFRKGIGVHAYSALTWNVDGGYSKFQATLGIDDSANDRSPGVPIGNVAFKVLADAKEIFDSGPVTSTDKPRVIALDIAKVKNLTLVVTFGDDGNGQGDHADWALARVIR
jgi:hypothetical protein